MSSLLEGSGLSRVFGKTFESAKFLVGHLTQLIFRGEREDASGEIMVYGWPQWPYRTLPTSAILPDSSFHRGPSTLRRREGWAASAFTNCQNHLVAHRGVQSCPWGFPNCPGFIPGRRRAIWMLYLFFAELSKDHSFRGGREGSTRCMGS